MKLSIQLSDLHENVISRKRTRGCPIIPSPLNRFLPLYRMHLQENGDTDTECGLNDQNILGTDSRWRVQNVKQRKELAPVHDKLSLQD